MGRGGEQIGTGPFHGANLEENLEDRNLYAPFGGVIGKRMVEAGENGSPGNRFSPC